MIDRERVMQLYRRGNTYRQIAAAIPCSEKQAGRIVREYKTEDDRFLHRHSRSGNEDKAWTALAIEGTTLNWIAGATGVSVQAVEQTITPYLKESI